MRKITIRSAVCLFLALFLALGTGIFAVKWVLCGGDWVRLPANQHMYINGMLNKGEILDRNGTTLAKANGDGTWSYIDSASVRRATLHAVGDPQGKIGVGAISAFADKLVGYNKLTGSAPYFSGGKKIYLTLDADVCRTAYQALNGRNGAVGVYNYRTGEIICMVSSPNYDPASAKAVAENDEENDGIYVNRLLSANFIPGSVFKLVTAAAALETWENAETKTWVCTGTYEADGSTVTCPKKHGELTLGEALTFSCNCIFGRISESLGKDVMEKYVEKTGFTEAISINGIHTSVSSFDFEITENGNLAWSGIGQGKDMVNPCAMMVYAGAIANGGTAAIPQLISKEENSMGLRTSIYLKHKTKRLLEEETAACLTEMMKDNVRNNYGKGNFPGLEIGAKSGTAQKGGEQKNNTWFVGFLENEEAPYAFVVFVEDKGSGSSAAGSVANKVLQAALQAADER